MFRLTPVVKNLIIINVVVFVVGMISPQMDFVCRVNEFLISPRPYNVVFGYLGMWFYQTDCFKPYQLFTYMFVHGGFFHIFFNMLMLAFMGPVLETYWGPKKFLIFYMVTGIGAAVFTIIVNMMGIGIASIMVGASGAIYGVMMGFGMMFPDMEVRLLFPPIPIKAKYLVFILGGITLLMDRSGEVAHFTHLGGIVAAFVLIQVWRKRG